jgi:hypothetical protein
MPYHIIKYKDGYRVRYYKNGKWNYLSKHAIPYEHCVKQIQAIIINHPEK